LVENSLRSCALASYSAAQPSGVCSTLVVGPGASLELGADLTPPVGLQLGDQLFVARHGVRLDAGKPRALGGSAFDLARMVAQRSGNAAASSATVVGLTG
jgi:hypothetical protein